jgi:hypothetical protein
VNKPTTIKKTLLALLGCILLSTPLMAPAQFQSGDFTYDYNESGITITRYSGLGGAVVIPDAIDGQPVTGVGKNAFGYNPDYITAVTIPASVTSIGEFAFLGCFRLTAIIVAAANESYSSVDGVLFDKNKTVLIQCPGGKAGSYSIPGTVASIGNFAFHSCAGLTTVTIPDGVLTIGDSAFENCTSLRSVTIPGSVTSLGLNALYYCTNLIAINVDAANTFYSSLDGVLFNQSQTTLMQFPPSKAVNYVIPGTVTSIGNSAFENCKALPGVTIPDSVTSIGSRAFAYCLNLTNLAIPSRVTGIGNSAFSFCTNLANITIPGSVKSIGNLAFAYCSGLNNLTISYGVASIPYGAFEYCTSLTDVTIPGSVTSIVFYAFYYCTSLANVAIPDSVTSLGEYAFYSCTSLASITIPGSVKSMGNFVFGFCTGLTNVTVLGGVTKIGAIAFYYCTSLTSVSIPGSLTSVEGAAFFGCVSLINITIPGAVTNIAADAFISCDNLRGVFFGGNAPSFGLPTFDIAATLYYLPGTTGWGAKFADRPTKLWNPRIQTDGPSFGVGPGGFGFNITGTTNIPIVVEACTNLTNATWVPLQTLNLTNGFFYFSDPNWSNYPARTYRIRSP